MILTMNGAEFELGASSNPAVASLQAALVALGKGIGDNILSKIVVDGAMGPKTAAATNRALTVHLGSGQAPTNLRSGSLSQGAITGAAEQITSLITAEVARRGFAAPAAAKIVRPKAAVAARPAAAAPVAQLTPLVPAAASPIYKVPAAAEGSDLSSVMMWAAIGVGVVALGGVVYYFATRKSSSKTPGLRVKTGVTGGFGNAARPAQGKRAREG
jgi:hypothetical protein